MKIRRVHEKRTGTSYFLVTDILSLKAMEKLLQLDFCKKLKNGFLFPGTPTFKRALLEIMQYDIKDESLKYDIKDEWLKREAEKATKEAERQARINSRAADYAFADEMKQSIINKQAVKGYTGRCPLFMNHQKAASMIADRFNKYAFFFDTGTGKTLLALDIIDKKNAKPMLTFWSYAQKLL